MASPYQLDAWHDFFTATAGSTAALAGLLFVGLSVNMTRILQLDKDTGAPVFTARALGGMIALINTMVISCIGLAPTLDALGFGLVVVLVGAESGLLPLYQFWLIYRYRVHRSKIWLNSFLTLLVTLSLFVTAVTLMVGHGGGLNWILLSFALATLVAAVNSWVLLVEILR